MGFFDKLKEGLKKKSIEIALSMLKEGLDIEVIMKVTKLTKEEIELINQKNI